MTYIYTDNAALDAYLQDKSYIVGYTPSQEDAVLFGKIAAAPCCKSCPHVARWYNHINSFAADVRSKWPAAKTAVVMPKPAAAKPAAEDDVDLFGDDEEDSGALAELQAKQKAAAKAKEDAAKSKKKIDKSQIVFDVKGWDENTDFEKLKVLIKELELDGLSWGEGTKIVPIAFGVSKLQVSCIIEDEKIVVDDIVDKICELEDYVQSVDIFAFNKV